MADLKGPTSKDTVQSGKTFTPKLTASFGSPKSLSNSSEEARRTIMGLRMASSSDMTSNVKGILTRVPK